MSSTQIGKGKNLKLNNGTKTPQNCQGCCECKPGFTRNKVNECVSEEDASKCRGPHEYFSCGGACDNVCATLQEMNQTNCPIINIKCNPMCYCESGYARNSNKTCVPIEQCETKELQLSGDENESLKHGLALFSMKLLYELVKDSIEMNYVISPMALFFPLSLLALYTTGSSNAQLLTALNAQNNEELNISSIFDQKSSGITGISKNYQDLWVTDALQKCFIIVSEKGSEAGAANAFQIGVRSLPNPPIEYTVFDVNRPFVFFITLNDTILFSGIKVQ
ncbi:unnamed protein product, partial [Iphiclides podalirius]